MPIPAGVRQAPEGADQWGHSLSRCDGGGNWPCDRESALYDGTRRRWSSRARVAPSTNVFATAGGPIFTLPARWRRSRFPSVRQVPLLPNGRARDGAERKMRVPSLLSMRVCKDAPSAPPRGHVGA